MHGIRRPVRGARHCPPARPRPPSSWPWSPTRCARQLRPERPRPPPSCPWSPTRGARQRCPARPRPPHSWPNACSRPTEELRRICKRTTPVDGFALGPRRDNVLVGGMDLGQAACLSCFPGTHLHYLGSGEGALLGAKPVSSSPMVSDPIGKSCQATYFCKCNYIHTVVWFQHHCPYTF